MIYKAKYFMLTNKFNHPLHLVGDSASGDIKQAIVTTLFKL